MKRKLLNLILSVCIIFSVSALTAITSADDTSIYTYSISGSEVQITDCDSTASGNLTIPSTLDGVLFDEDKTDLFVYPANKSDDAYTIPEGVDTLKPYSFMGTQNLTSVVLPEGVNYIGGTAFMDSKLTEIHLPKSLYSIEYNAFMRCKSLTDVYFNGTQNDWSNISIAQWGNDPLLNANIQVFFNCNGIASVALPESLTTIGSQAFYNCYNLAYVTIYNDVTNIGTQAFGNCSVLKSIDLSYGIEVISAEAFSNSGLQSVTLPENLKKIESGAFFYTYIENITLPKKR